MRKNKQTLLSGSFLSNILYVKLSKYIPSIDDDLNKDPPQNQKKDLTHWNGAATITRI
jgi:hypothetical protein